jgi:hypothetical protein
MLFAGAGAGAGARRHMIASHGARSATHGHLTTPAAQSST